MKPRVLKKLCKKVYEIVGDGLGKVWLDNEEPFAYEYMKSTKQNEKSTMTGLFVIGGGFDYFGEAEDALPIFYCAQELVLWKLGTPTYEKIKDDFGIVIDNVEGWPSYPRRLTGKEVIQKLKALYS